MMRFRQRISMRKIRIPKFTKIEQDFDKLMMNSKVMLDTGFPVVNFQFLRHLGRGFEIDRAWPDLKVGVELQGGTWSTSKDGHNRGSLMDADIEKHNLAILDGWRLLYFTTSQIRSFPAQVILSVEYALKDQWARDKATSLKLFSGLTRLKDFYLTKTSIEYELSHRPERVFLPHDSSKGIS